jgi:cytochrome c-type biogenesis protein CcmE
MSLTPSQTEIRRRRWYAVGALCVGALAIVAVTSTGIGQNLVYYWTPTEMLEAGDRAVGASIRLGGQVVDGTVVQLDDALLVFDITDGTSTVTVRSHGIPPQMFRAGIGVVLEGTVHNAAEGVFDSSRLMVSHDNEYRTPEEGEAIDIKEMLKTAEEMDGYEGRGRSQP